MATKAQKAAAQSKASAGTSTVRTLEGFRAKLAGGGARPNLFEVAMDAFPSGIEDAIWGDGQKQNFRFLCKAAQLPASTIAEIPVPFRGRILKVAGDRTFEPWTVTVINDEGFDLRHAFEIWMHGMSDLITNTGITNPASYMTNATVTQFGRGDQIHSTENSSGNQVNSILRKMTFRGLMPTEVSAIDLSYDSTDTIEEFTVTFQVMDWYIGAEEENENEDGDSDKGNKSKNNKK